MIFLAMSVGCPPLSVPINQGREDFFNQLGEMADTYIIFCYIQELSEFYLYNLQPITINRLCLIFHRDIKLDLKYLGDMLYRLKKS